MRARLPPPKITTRIYVVLPDAFFDESMRDLNGDVDAYA